MSNKQNRGAGQTGHYIALGLCAVAICISGYLYTLRNQDPEPQTNDPDHTVAATLPGEDVPAVATKPQQTDPTQGTKPSTEPTQKKPLRTCAPVEGQTVAVYAVDALSYNQTTRDWRTHDGLDIGADEGTVVRAAADGTVYAVYADDVLGMTVVINHDDGYTTQYSSLSTEVTVAPGDSVTMGQTIGTVGSTALLETTLGAHVHFSVTQNGAGVDPADFLTLD